MKTFSYYVYIMASERGTLYIGVTNHIHRRILEHQEGNLKGFSQKYQCTKLIYVEKTDSIESAIAREKQLKKWNRDKKEDLIRIKNPQWKDLSKEIETEYE